MATKDADVLWMNVEKVEFAAAKMIERRVF
jgi:hypothetical protein